VTIYATIRAHMAAGSRPDEPLDGPSRTDLYHGLFRWYPGRNGRPSVAAADPGPGAVPCPSTGRPLRVAAIEAHTAAICPRCATEGQGGFVSFVADLRMAYACPECRELVWLAGL
jgi:hypothetical protein